MNRKTVRPVIILLSALFLAALLSGCPSPGITHTLAVSSDPEGAGTVSAAPASETYLEGTVVFLSAAPASGYAFSGWEGDAEGTYATAAVCMDGDKTVTAKFTALPPETYSLTITVLPPGSGTVSLSPPAPGYAAGSSVTLTATAAPGYVFSSWSGDTTGSTNPKALTMNGNKNVTAAFASQNPGGSVQGTALSLSGTVSTLCGVPGTSGHLDGTGVGALFHGPERMVMAGSYLYIADSGSHRIRRLNPATGKAETFSGSGTAGHLDGPAATARFHSPYGIATDGTNYLYVTCTGSYTVRRVSLSDGSVETLAGIAGTYGFADSTSGLSATFGDPRGLAYVPGPPAALYVCDSNYHTIRKITLAGSYEVTTFAGTAGSSGEADDIGPAARFNNPYGLAAGGASLWVADRSAHRIREIILSTAQVITRAGDYYSSGYQNGTGSAARFYNPQEVAVSGNTLYIADSYNHALRAMNTSTYAVTTLTGANGNGYSDGGPAAARFSYPSGMALSGTSLYVSDINQVIRRVDTGSRNTLTLAGCAGHSGVWNGTGTGAVLHYPLGITTDGDYLYTTDSYHTVRKTDRTTGAVTTLAGSPGNPGNSDGFGSSAFFYNPHGITSSGNYLYLCDRSNHTIRKIDKATGEVSTFAGSPGASGYVDAAGSDARFSAPQGITSDGQNLYVTEYLTIRKINISTAEVTTLAGSTEGSGDTDSSNGPEARFNWPMGITTDGGKLYVCDQGNRLIRTVDLASTEVATLAGLSGVSGTADGTGASARFVSPNYITCDGTYLYVTDSNAVRRIHIASREVLTIAGSDSSGAWADGTGGAARFYTPLGITTDGGSLYVCDSTNHVIRKID